MAWLSRFAPVVVWMAVIFYLSHQTGDELGGWLPFFQIGFPMMASFDWGHYCLYFVLALTGYWAYWPKSSSWSGKALVILFCVAYGITDEFHQRFVPGRTPDLSDLLHDGIGAAVAMAFVSLPGCNAMLRKWTAANKKY